MSLSEALEILHDWQVPPTALKLITTPRLFRPASEGREDFRELDVTIDSIDGAKLRLSHNGKSEQVDLSGATFASIPGVLQVTFLEDNKSIVLSDRRA